MTPSPVISNSSPLIALEHLGHLDLLEKLFGAVIIPPAVARELAPRILPTWITEHRLSQPIGAQILGASLGNGESEAISLALELSAQLVILDDRPARRLAKALGLSVIGTLGALLLAKQKGLLSVIKPEMEALVNFGFRISQDLYVRVLNDAGEK